jgi:hypothetical protein
VQYAPGLFRHLKAVIDANRTLNGQFLLTGSRKLSLINNISESLPGRADIVEFETLSFAEIRDALAQTRLQDAMVRGGYPELYANLDIDAVAFYNSTWQPTWNAMCALSRMWVACVISSAFCVRAQCALPTCSTKLVWPAMLALLRQLPTSGSRFWRLPAR